MKTKLSIGSSLLLMIGVATNLAAQAPDSVVIRVGKESRVVFSIKDKKDLETLKHYNFQALMDDMVQKLEKRDSTALTKPSSEYLLKDTTRKDSVRKAAEIEKAFDDWPSARDEGKERNRRHYGRRTYHSFNMDLGMNNYLENGSFPDATNQLYTVKPWGSWYVSLNSVLRTHMTGRFFVEWGAGVSWYNFKFNNPAVLITTDNNGVVFSQDPRNLSFTKSKLTTSYINLSIVPVLDFGNSRKNSAFSNNDRSNSFRVGFGPYAGYRIDSYTKQVWTENDNKFKSHDHDNYYMNNIRYGLRLQLGFRSTDIFFNYDLNDLFVEAKGPKLQAFSFGITL